MLLLLAANSAAPQSDGNVRLGLVPQSRGEPQVRAYADPGRDPSDPLDFFRSQEQPTSIGGPAFCVRLCDGRYFPLQRQGEMAPAELCNAFCPAARTKVFFGGDIAGARAPDGTRYSNLDTAFVYRDRLVADCTCNGRTNHGLVTLDATRDPTLRPGDIVATKDGLLAFQGSRARRGAETADFTPIDRSRLSRDLRQRLGSVAVSGRN
jgi:Protein of unknown function (DUF2865)